MRHFNFLRNGSSGVAGSTQPPSTTPTDKKTPPEDTPNKSNEWRIYAKMEANYHLSNKYALFYNMSKYYRAIGRDPFDVLPLTFHIRKGTSDKIFYKFLSVFREHEERMKEALA